MSLKYFENIYGANHYDRHSIIIKEANGCWVTDVKGKEYLDCLAAYSAVNQGHNHPYIVSSVVNTLEKHRGSIISNVVYNELSGEFVTKLCRMVPQLGNVSGSYNNKALLKNGGVESVETAIKCMRHVGWQKGIPDGKQEIIVFDSNFHGRMTTIISFSSSEKYRKGFGPLTTGFVNVPYSNLKAVEQAINKNTCGILVEPMQGEGGMRVPYEGFLRDLRKIANDNGLMLVFDEIQVGLGRTGKMFCFEHDGVRPDGLILGKALSGGMVPLSAFVTDAVTMDSVFTPGTDGSTYGGYPLACAAGIAALEVIRDEDLPEQSAKKGAKLRTRIESIAKQSPYVREVRGKGLFIGIEVKQGNAMELCKRLLNHGVLANDSHGHTIRISPPLIINNEEMTHLTRALSKILL